MISCQGSAFGELFAGVVELVAADEVDDRVVAQRLLRQHGDVRADKADLGVGILRLDASAHSTSFAREGVLVCRMTSS